MDPTVQSVAKEAGAYLKFDFTSDQSLADSMARAQELGIWDAIKDMKGTAYCVAINPKTGKTSAATPLVSKNEQDYFKIMAEVN